MSIFGDRVKAARKMRGWSQKELADKAGTSQQNIQRYETEDREPQSSNLLAISKALGVTVSYLLGTDTDEMKTETALSADEMRLIQLYRSTDQRGKAAIMAIAESQRGDDGFQASINQAI